MKQDSLAAPSIDPIVISELDDKTKLDHLQSFLHAPAENKVMRAIIADLLMPQGDFLSAILPTNLFECSLIEAIKGDSAPFDRLNIFEKIVLANVCLAYGHLDQALFEEVLFVLEHTFSLNGKVMTLFLLSEDEARRGAFVLLGYTLIDRLHRMKKLEGRAHLKERFYDAIEALPRSLECDVEILADLLYQGLHETNDVKFNCSGKTHRSLFSYHDAGLDIRISFEGKNSGVASIAYDEVFFPMIGPQVGDVGDAAQFGVEFYMENSSHWRSSETSCVGWSRLFGDKDVWVEHAFSWKEGSCHIEVTFETIGTQCTLSESIFVVCEQIFVDGKPIKASSLQRHESIAKQIELRGRTENIYLDLQSEAICQIIPLAGDAHYWGANFILAFEPRGKHFSFSLTSG